MTADTPIIVGNVRFVVRDILKNIKTAGSREAARSWAYYIERAFITDYNQEIADAVDELLREYNEPEFSLVHEFDLAGVEPPILLSNTIFNEELKASPIEEAYIYIDIEKLWIWIYLNLVSKLKNKYEWLALLLFANAHGLLQSDINTKKFCDEMVRWFGVAYTKIKASYSQVTCYQRGFFQSNSFKYRQWVEGKGALPYNYRRRKDQKVEGFARIHEVCRFLENNYEIDYIIVKDSNR